MSSKPRLGVYLNHLHFTDGEFTVTNSEAISFIKHAFPEYQISVCASAEYQPDIQVDKHAVVLEKMGFKVLHLPPWKSIVGSIPSLILSFTKNIKRAYQFVEDNDLIWLRVPSMVALLFWVAAKRIRKPTIVHVVANPMLAPFSSKYRGIKKFFARLFSYILLFSLRIMCRYGLVVTAGGDLQKLLSTTCRPVFLLDDVLVGQNELKSAKRTPGKVTNLLYVGRFAYGKGIDVLIDSVKELIREFPEIHLKMAGGGELFDDVKKEVAIRGLQDTVEFLGFVSPHGPLQRLYRNSDIFVIPSDGYPEGFPRVILEAWAAGVPLIATRWAGIPYKVKHQENGILVTPGSKEELVDALRRLISDEDLRTKIAEGGTRTIRDYTFEKQKIHIQKLLNTQFREGRLN